MPKTLFRETVAGSANLFELHRRVPQDYPFLLQSVAPGPQSGRYDILFAFPTDALRMSADSKQDFFATLDAAHAENHRAQQDPQPTPLPFLGGWFLLLGYEMAGHIEPLLRLPKSPYRLPEALAVRCPSAVIFDHSRSVIEVVSDNDSALQRMKSDVSHLLATPPATPDSVKSLIETLDEEPAEHFETGVRQILEYLKAGDVFQVNLSRGWRGTLRANSSYQDIYRQLCQSNPAPFAGLAVWNDTAVISSSPERLVRVADGIVQTRPIAGTRPRSAVIDEDRSLRERLLASFKERAEHIMLIDLERNDLGRVCEPGSIEVDELMQIESYTHVHHIVSNVRGRLRAGARHGDVLRAVFPGGTITGCPKVRAMQIIAELEGEGRGPYTGAMGYLSDDGRMDTNILIRSLVCAGQSFSFRTGAGIVADSIPADELAETRIKARGLLNALRVVSP